MATLTDEQRRALRLLARSPNGSTEALMLAHGFESAMLSDLVLNGLAVAVDHSTMAGRRRMKVTWLRITAAGRQAIAE
jgi:phage portal protein BeeE